MSDRYSLYDAAKDFAKASLVGAAFGGVLIYGATKAWAASDLPAVMQDALWIAAPVVIFCIILYLLICALRPEIPAASGYDDDFADRHRRTVEDDARSGQ